MSGLARKIGSVSQLSLLAGDENKALRHRNLELQLPLLSQHFQELSHSWGKKQLNPSFLSPNATPRTHVPHKQQQTRAECQAWLGWANRFSHLSWECICPRNPCLAMGWQQMRTSNLETAICAGWPQTLRPPWGRDNRHLSLPVWNIHEHRLRE